MDYLQIVYGVVMVVICVGIAWIWDTFYRIDYGIVALEEPGRRFTPTDVASIKRRVNNGVVFKFIELHDGRFFIEAQHMLAPTFTQSFVPLDVSEGRAWRDKHIVPARFVSQLANVRSRARAAIDSLKTSR